VPVMNARIAVDIGITFSVVWKMTFNISEKQASLCRVGCVILWFWMCDLVTQAFRGTKCLSFLVSLTLRCSVRYRLSIRIELLYNSSGGGFSLYVLQMVCMRSKRFEQGCTHPERPVVLATKLCVVAPNIFSTIKAVHFSLQNVCGPP